MEQQGELLLIDVRGAGFLRNMVRVMVGTLVEIGMGRRPHTDVAYLLRQGCRQKAGRTAPAQGLCLMEVWY
jgi:tRNA pseudouridine38-40 synthase